MTSTADTTTDEVVDMARTCAGGNGIDGRTPAEASTSGAARPGAVESAQAANTRTVARHAALADMERANSTTDFRVLIMDTRLLRLDVYRNVSSNSAKAGTEPRHSRGSGNPFSTTPPTSQSHTPPARHPTSPEYTPPQLPALPASCRRGRDGITEAPASRPRAASSPAIR